MKGVQGGEERGRRELGAGEGDRDGGGWKVEGACRWW